MASCGDLWVVLVECRASRLSNLFGRKKSVSLRDRKLQLQTEIRQLQEQKNELETGGLPLLRMTSCRLSVAANTELDELFRSPQWTREHVSSLCDAAMEPIGPLPSHNKQWLDDMPVQMGAFRPRPLHG